MFVWSFVLFSLTNFKCDDSRERQTENASRFANSMDMSVKNLVVTAQDQTKKCQQQYKREYQKIGQTFHMLGTSFDLDNSSGEICKL